MTRFRPLVLAAALFVAPRAAVAQAPARQADLVFAGGKVFTADSTRFWAEAIAIAEGRVIAVGTTAEVRRLVGPHTLVYELGGRVLVPGFNDAHMHVSAGVAGTWLDVGSGPMPDPPLAELLDSLSAAATRTPRGSWLLAGVGLSVLASAAPLRDALDRVAPEHPVLLYAAGTGHGYGFNSAGFRSLGIVDATADPSGGWLERDGSGRPTGVLQEYAGWDAFARLNGRLPDSLHVAAVQQRVAEALGFGITSIQHMANLAPPALVLRSIREAAPPIRFRVIRMPLPDAGGGGAEWRAAGRAIALTGNARVEGWKWILDGTPIERLAAVREPYTDRPGWYGRIDFPVETIRTFLRDALRGSGPGDQLMLHVTGDSSAALVLRLMTELAPDSAWRSRRVRFEHGDGLMQDLWPLAGRLGIIVVQNPAHFTLASIAARLGDRRGREYQPFRSLKAAGIPLAIGSDGPTNPFLNIMFATTHPNNPPEALSREEAVIAYTRGSAYAEFAEGEKGRLAAGQLADLAVLSQDIFTVEAPALPDTRSVLTLIGGRVAYDAGVLKVVR